MPLLAVVFRLESVCCRTDYHVAPEDLLRLELAVFPSSIIVTFQVSYVKTQSQEADHTRSGPHRGRAIVRVPSSHVHARGARVCL